MKTSRWVELMNSQEHELTTEEVYQGYHWCSEWDGLLVGPDMPEWGEDVGRCLCGFLSPCNRLN